MLLATNKEGILNVAQGKMNKDKAVVSTYSGMAGCPGETHAQGGERSPSWKETNMEQEHFSWL